MFGIKGIRRLEKRIHSPPGLDQYSPEIRTLSRDPTLLHVYLNIEIACPTLLRVYMDIGIDYPTLLRVYMDI